ncbi:MAG: alkaline phosphatase family protein [bacterium]
MDKKIVELAEKTLNTKLVSSDNISKLESIFDSIKKANYSKSRDIFKPDQKQSIKNLADFIEKAFSLYNEVVVFACDAISYEYYLSDIQKKSKKYSHRIGILSSVFPSTTSTVWPSIITGTSPSEHGIYGTSFLHEKLKKNYIWISNTINHKSERAVINDMDLVLNLSHKETIFEKLKNKGINSYYLGSHGQRGLNPFRKELIAGSTHIDPGIKYAELKKDPQRLVDYFLDKDEELLKMRNVKKLIWNYVDFDDYVHEQGYKKLSVKLDWNTIFRFWKKNKKNRLFLLISDHGQIAQTPKDFNILKASSDNKNLKYNSGGAGRVVYFYPKDGREQEIYEWVKKIVGNSGLVLKKEELVSLGLLNNKAVGFDRIGSVVAIATSPHFPSVGNTYVSEHGSLSSIEMFVPIIIQI